MKKSDFNQTHDDQPYFILSESAKQDSAECRNSDSGSESEDGSTSGSESEENSSSDNDIGKQ